MYSDEFKAQVMAECEEPGASVAKVAMSHGIDDDVAHDAIGRGNSWLGWLLACRAGPTQHCRSR